MNIVELAYDMAAAVHRFLAKARQFYYRVMLFNCRCPKCKGPLTMIHESRCCCDDCHYVFDPTVIFQRCSHCGGIPVLKVRRYQCRQCGNGIASVFLFDGSVFDTEYFRRKMAASRRRRNQQRERIRKMLAESRSTSLALGGGDLDSIPGLVKALNGLAGGLDVPLPPLLRGTFDLGRYQDHIQSVLIHGPVSLRRIPALIDNARLDLIWRFVAVIFLAHRGSVRIRQQGETIWVMQSDDREGQELPGDATTTDCLRGSLCHAQAG